MDRDDVRQSLRVIQEVTEEVKSGRNFLIFPEGTRSKERNHPGEFKGGSFKCAIKARCPIVPVAMLDSYKAFDTNSIRPVTVQVHFLKPVSYTHLHEKGWKIILRLHEKEVRRRLLPWYIPLFILGVCFIPMFIAILRYIVENSQAILETTGDMPVSYTHLSAGPTSAMMSLTFPWRT